MAACICFASLVGLAVRDLVSKPYTLQKDKYDHFCFHIFRQFHSSLLRHFHIFAQVLFHIYTQPLFQIYTQALFHIYTKALFQIYTQVLLSVSLRVSVTCWYARIKTALFLIIYSPRSFTWLQGNKLP